MTFGYNSVGHCNTSLPYSWKPWQGIGVCKFGGLVDGYNPAKLISAIIPYDVIAIVDGWGLASLTTIKV